MDYAAATIIATAFFGFDQFALTRKLQTHALLAERANLIVGERWKIDRVLDPSRRAIIGSEQLTETRTGRRFVAAVAEHE